MFGRSQELVAKKSLLQLRCEVPKMDFLKKKHEIVTTLIMETAFFPFHQWGPERLGLSPFQGRKEGEL
jgi:hypothetical protein